MYEHYDSVCRTIYLEMDMLYLFIWDKFTYVCWIKEFFRHVSSEELSQAKVWLRMHGNL